MIGLHLLQQVADAAAFELENALGLAAAQQGECLGVVERKLIGIDPLAGGLLDQLDALGQNRQVAQTQEVHLQQAGRFDVAHRPLGDDFFFAGHAAQRDVLDQRPIGDHHRRGVRADVAGEPLDLHGQIDQLADFRIVVVDPFQIGAGGNRLFERDVQFLGHQGDDRVDARNGHSQGPADVANGRPGGQRAERADLGDVGGPVRGFDVLDDFAPAILAKVDVDIGRFQPAFVQKPLEEQIVFQRADVAQIECVADQRADARTASRGRNALLPGVADKIPDDQESSWRNPTC